jgi:alpha-L-rhamnosidase
MRFGQLGLRLVVGAFGSVTLFAALAVPSAAFARDMVDSLRVESLVDPVGLDEVSPRFSWILHSDRLNAKQVGYRIVVATDPASLAEGKTKVWDSGKVTSAANTQVEYAGPALQPRQRYHFNVQVWDDTGKSLRAANAGFFETGYLSPQGFDAKWITLRPTDDTERLPLSRAQWIWASGVPAATKQITFQKVVLVRPNEHVRSAKLTVASPVYIRHWPERLDYAASLGGRLFKTPIDVGGPQTWDVSDALVSGDNLLTIAVPARQPERITALLVVEMDDGTQRFFATDTTWTAQAWKEEVLPPQWRTTKVLAEPSSLKVTALGAFAAQYPNADVATAKAEAAIPPAHLRKDFVISKPVARARLYATAAGVYEPYLNGRRVGDQIFAPGWTEYSKRTPYQTYDVTALLPKGANTLGALLADGWYSGTTGMGTHVFGAERAFRARLEVEYRDGSKEAIVTDESWQGSMSGPIRESTFFHGEIYDARKESNFAAWSATGFAAKGWRAVHQAHPNIGELYAQTIPPIRKKLEVTTVKMSQPRNGDFIFDVGQNLAGWARLRLPNCAEGTRVRLRFGEILNDNGTLFTGNMRTARMADEYICKGGGPEVFEPSFTFHGFRFVEVVGWPAGSVPTAAALTAVVIHTDLPFVGSFETSDPLLNRLHQNIVWTARSNFMSVPIDCPQRDERLGWAGDIQLFTPTAAFGIDLSAFVSNYVQAFVDAQSANGAFPDFAPKGTGDLPGVDGHFGWADAGIILPWHLYQLYGDQRILKKHFGAYKKWVDLLSSQAKNDLVDGWSYGDWVSPKPQTPNNVIAPIFHAHAADLVARIAGMIGQPADAAKYAEVAKRVRAAFVKKFVAADGKIESDTQTAYALALDYEMLPVALRPKAVEHLVAAVHRANDHVGTGLMGTVHLLPLLSRTGHMDLAYKLLFQDTNPSWIFAVKNGATTIWERWDSWTPEKGPSNLGGMNSYNHYAFGVVGQWIYENIAGMRPTDDANGWDKFENFPKPGGGLTWAKASHDTVRGRIESSWKLNNGTITMQVVVPVHATARVYVPTSDLKSVKVGTPKISAAGTVTNAVYFDLGAGSYSFTATAPNTP